MTKKSLCVVLLLAAAIGALASSPSYAAAASCSSIECTDEIDRIYITSFGGKPRVYVSIEDRKLAGKSLSCTLVSGWYFTLTGDHPAFNQIFSLLMEAKSRKSPQIGSTEGGRNRVSIRIVDNSPICEIGYVWVNWSN